MDALVLTSVHRLQSRVCSVHPHKHKDIFHLDMLRNVHLDMLRKISKISFNKFSTASNSGGPEVLDGSTEKCPRLRPAGTATERGRSHLSVIATI